MPAIAGKIGWKLTTIAVGIPIGIAVRKVSEKVWTTVRSDDAPRIATDPEVGWGDALAWAAVSGVAAALAELATLRGASSVWRSLTGDEPPGAPSSIAGKKAVQLD